MKAPASHAGSRGLLSRLLNRAPKESKHGDESLYRRMSVQAVVYQPGKPVWSGRNYQRFADEGYIRNVIAHRSVDMIASSAASVPWMLFDKSSGEFIRLKQHPVLTLLEKPNPLQGGAELFHGIYAFRLISGNAFLQAAGPREGAPLELHSLRPDRISVIAGRDGLPQTYRHTVGEQATDYPVDRMTGRSRVLHLKAFHPLNDWYGLSPIEAAAYSIDQHNQAGAWNQALLQNGARPSGALVVGGGADQTLSEEQYHRIKEQMDSQFSGPTNAGRPLLLEGGLEWREMSLSPKEMDFIEVKNSAARDIALAFGVPPQLLGIPGDNTYANLAEARLALWEQTILPLVDGMCDALNNWLLPQFGGRLELRYDTDGIPALSERRDKLWNRANASDFLTDDEKREMVGLRKC